MRTSYKNYNNKDLKEKKKMAKPLSENAKKVWTYLKENDGENLTAADIADATGLTTKQVNGIVTAALQRKGYSVRKENVIKTEEGSKTVKFISLTEEGLALDPDNVPEASDAE